MVLLQEAPAQAAPVPKRRFHPAFAVVIVGLVVVAVLASVVAVRDAGRPATPTQLTSVKKEETTKPPLPDPDSRHFLTDRGAER